MTIDPNILNNSHPALRGAFDRAQGALSNGSSLIQDFRAGTLDFDLLIEQLPLPSDIEEKAKEFAAENPDIIAQFQAGTMDINAIADALPLTNDQRSLFKQTAEAARGNGSILDLLNQDNLDTATTAFETVSFAEIFTILLQALSGNFEGANTTYRYSALYDYGRDEWGDIGNAIKGAIANDDPTVLGKALSGYSDIYGIDDALSAFPELSDNREGVLVLMNAISLTQEEKIDTTTAIQAIGPDVLDTFLSNYDPANPIATESNIDAFSQHLGTIWQDIDRSNHNFNGLTRVLHGDTRNNAETYQELEAARAEQAAAAPVTGP